MAARKPRKPTPQSEVNRVLRAWEEWMETGWKPDAPSAAEMAHKLGYPKSTIYHWRTRPPTLVSPADAATMLGVCRATIYNLIARGELRSVRLGRSRRIPMYEIERLAEQAP